MKFFIVSLRGDACGMALRLKQEGNEVCIYFKEAYAKKSLEGMIDKVYSINAGLALNPDVVVFDSTGLGKKADELRKQGIPVVGAGAIQDKLELDREYCHEVMEGHGIGIPKSFDFPNFMSAVKFVTTHKERLVMKPSGNKNPELTFSGKTNDELINYMIHLKKNLHTDGPVVMQEFIEGTECSTEIWYTNGERATLPNATLETKKFLHGNVGPGTGAETSVVFWYEQEDPKIVKQSFEKMESFLQAAQITGPIDINGILKEGKFYGLEFTPRMGYNAMYALIRTFDEDLGAFFYRMSHGDPTPPRLKNGFGYALRTTLPPYPFKPDKGELSKHLYDHVRGLPIGGLEKEDLEERVFLLDVYQKGKEIYSAGIDGVICECTGWSMDDPKEAEEEAVEVFKKLEMPHKQARLGDGAQIAIDRMKQLQEMGYEVPPFEESDKMAEEPTKEKKDETTIIQVTPVTVVPAPVEEVKPTDLPAYAHMAESTTQQFS